VIAPRTLRARLALSIALTVLGSMAVFSVTTFGAFYLAERSEAKSHQLAPAAQRAEDEENLAVALKAGGAMAVAVPLAVAAAAALGLWLAGRALAPMREAAARARDARSSELELRLPVTGNGDEWDELAGVMNELLHRHHQSIAREKAFSANAAHELRTPLTALLGEVQVSLRRERTVGEYRASLEAMEAEVARLSSLVDALLTLSRSDSGELRTASVAFDLAAIAADSRERVRGQGARGAVELAAVATPVRGDPLLTGRILDNLIENALRHGAGTVLVEVGARDAWGFASIVDDGPGLPAAIRARLFERFNKSPGAGEGFGLGLAIAHALTAAQGGRLRLEDGAPRTRFVLELPLGENALPN
jgi:signal transduction histidine kinase